LRPVRRRIFEDPRFLGTNAMNAVPASPYPGNKMALDGSGRRRAVVRARAPLRLGLAGGGTDLVSYSSQHGGAVLNATIDRYAFASIRARDDHSIFF
jgi:hypothetical protein